ncbi:MAG: capsule assembly Wzi family protein [bacterium]|nr:capsule assembly Wzi family protein [bacterium]
MKKKIPLYTNLLFAIWFVAGSVGAGVMPVGQPEYDFLYDRFERVDALTLDRFDYQRAPYRLDRWSDLLGPFKPLDAVRGDKLLFGFLAAEELSFAREARPQGFEKLRGVVAGQPLNKLSVYGSFVLDEALAKDENYTGKKWRGLAGSVRQAFVAYNTDRFDLIAGRYGGFWGPRRSLLFSSGQNLDGFGYSLRWGRLVISYRLARLDGRTPERDGVESFENRYLAAHRYDFHISPKLTVGLFETVVFGGPGRQLELFYLNPLIFFHGTQLNESLDDNTMVGFDFSFKPKAGIKLYGQVLVDDLQFDSRVESDKEPDQLGIVSGGYFADVIENTDVRLEYSRVSNWTFNQRFERNRYLNDGTPVGSALGNDYDRIELAVIRWLQDFLSVSANLSYWRQGEGRVDAEWTMPWLEVEGNYSEPFPTGVVQKTLAASLGAKGFLCDHFFFDLEAGFDRIENRLHVKGVDDTLPFVNLTVSGFFLPIVDIH